MSFGGGPPSFHALGAPAASATVPATSHKFRMAADRNDRKKVVMVLIDLNFPALRQHLPFRGALPLCIRSREFQRKPLDPGDECAIEVQPRIEVTGGPSIGPPPITSMRGYTS